MTGKPGATDMLLMTPGPTRVPERVLRAGARPMLHHRSPQFSRELAEMLHLMAPVFGTRQPVLPVHTTGRGALEAVICNCFSPGDELIASCNGKFGEMWASIAESYALVVHRISTDWSRSTTAGLVERALFEHPKSRAVAIALCDSSTGVQHDIAAIAAVAHAHDALILVDGVSAIGGMAFAFDAWNVDVAVTASQKCLMSSPGLAFAVLGERAWRATETARIPRNYWHLGAVRENVTKAKPETPGTTPVHLVMQVAESLRMMHEEGLEAVYARHESMARHTRIGIEQLGLTLQCPQLEAQSPTLTAVALPADIAPGVLREHLKLQGVLTAAGLGEFASTGFRIGHMGDIRREDVERTLKALGGALQEIRESPT